MKRLIRSLSAVAFSVFIAIPDSGLAADGKTTEDDNTYVTVSTSHGDFTLMLYDETPLHRDNFIRLCNDGTYEGVLFHRVIKDFLIQEGIPRAKSSKPAWRMEMGMADIAYIQRSCLKNFASKVL